MKSLFRSCVSTLLIASLLALGSCGIFGSPGTLDNEGQVLTPLITTIADRHDTYIINDANLPGELRAAYQRDSADVLAAFAQATIEAQALAPKLNVVLDRHDGYVTSDGTLNAQQRSLYLLSTRNVRRTVAAALGR